MVDVKFETLFHTAKFDTKISVFTLIVNESLNLAVFPDCFKLALLNPLLKKPRLDVDVLSNSRPISNPKFISKLIEKVVASQLLSIGNHTVFLVQFGINLHE